MNNTFIKLFWKHKFDWKMWVRLIFFPLMAGSVIASTLFDKIFHLLDDHLPKVDKK